jgi:hypothetical protein
VLFVAFVFVLFRPGPSSSASSTGDGTTVTTTKKATGTTVKGSPTTTEATATTSSSVPITPAGFDDPNLKDDPLHKFPTMSAWAANAYRGRHGYLLELLTAIIEPGRSICDIWVGTIRPEEQNADDRVGDVFITTVKQEALTAADHKRPFFGLPDEFVITPLFTGDQCAGAHKPVVTELTIPTTVVPAPVAAPAVTVKP